ncbi:F-box domain-containing protein [Mycena kentingensis (nom. inval.)]|nr:F-box domain-containing protein [Mycena kentingensis (nom. inval.)]
MDFIYAVLFCLCPPRESESDYLQLVPVELWLRIGSNADRATLKNLTLACHSFRSTFQPLLFEKILVVVPKAHKGGMEPFTTDFSSIAENPVFVLAVKTGHFSNIPPSLFTRLPEFQNIRALTLWDTDDIPSKSVRKAIDALPRLRHLHLYGVTLESGKVLPLESFTFAGDSRATAEITSVDTMTHQPLHIIDPTTIRRLVLHGADGPMNIIQSMFGESFPLLKYLILDIPRGFPNERIVAFLKGCTQLETLGLYNHSPSGFGQQTIFADSDCMRSAKLVQLNIAGAEARRPARVTISARDCARHLATPNWLATHAASLLPGRSHTKLLVLATLNTTGRVTIAATQVARLSLDGFGYLHFPHLAVILPLLASSMPRLTVLKITLPERDLEEFITQVKEGDWYIALPPRVETLELKYRLVRGGPLGGLDMSPLLGGILTFRHGVAPLGASLHYAKKAASALSACQGTGALKKLVIIVCEQIVAMEDDGFKYTFNKGADGEWKTAYVIR